ncbi:MAG TPA: non-homologous end-joining DNA ligase [Terriglobia bacterium]|nr:non-homologous end-joining DNA ligase [Terriglobia bacterium]
MTTQSEHETVRIGRRIVEITSPEKVLFPNDGITKWQLVDYYRRIAPTMLPYLRGRPIVMERYPDGIHSPGFFEKNARPYYPDWIEIVPIRKQNGIVRHVICNDAATLVYLANLAVITPHAWLSRVDKLENPDQMIFDLDPSDGEFRAVCTAAKQLREQLKERGLTAFVKSTGSRGLHVVVPLYRRATFDQVRAFARDVATQFAQSDPEHLTIEVRKNKRQGRIFVDTARNAYAQTAAPAYAVRPRDGAPVAAPLNWNELDSRSLKPDAFNIRNIFDRIETIGDPWKNLSRHAQKLPR